MDNMEHISVSNEAAQKLLEYIFSPERLIDEESIGYIGHEQAVQIELEGFEFYARRAEDEATLEGTVITEEVINGHGFPEPRQVVLVKDSAGRIMQKIIITKAITAVEQRGMATGMKFALDIIREQDEKMKDLT
jgi:hypothetical protein